MGVAVTQIEDRWRFSPVPLMGGESFQLAWPTGDSFISVVVNQDMVVDEAVVFSSEFEGRTVFGLMLLEQKPVVHNEEKIGLIGFGRTHLGLSGGDQPHERYICAG